jgi:hypothetical protein
MAGEQDYRGEEKKEVSHMQEILKFVYIFFSVFLLIPVARDPANSRAPSQDIHLAI